MNSSRQPLYYFGAVVGARTTSVKINQYEFVSINAPQSRSRARLLGRRRRARREDARTMSSDALADEERASSASHAPGTSTDSRSPTLDEEEHRLDGARERWTQAHLAAPVCVSMCMSTVRDIVTIRFVGRLPSDDSAEMLGGWALAQTLLNVLGKSIMVGLVSAVSTIAGVAYGHGNYSHVGHVTQRAVVILTVTASALVVGVHARAEAFLTHVCGQSEDVASVAGRAMRGLIPALFAYTWTQCAQVYLYAQGIVVPQAVGGVVALVCHPLFNVVFIRWLGWGVEGAAYACSASEYISLIIILAYSTVWRRTYREGDEALAVKRDACWPGWSATEAFSPVGIFEVLRLGIPGVFVKAEWWASDLVRVFAGWLPNPDVGLAALSVYAVSNAFVFSVSIGLGVSVLTRVAHELGMARVSHATHAVRIAYEMIAVVAAVVAAAIFFGRNFWTEIFTDDDDVTRLASRLMMILAVYALFDAFGAVSTGVLRACGRQVDAARVVFVAYYLIGVPVSIGLAFGTHAGVTGLVVGGTVGTIVHSLTLLYVVSSLDWDAEIKHAREREHIFSGRRLKSSPSEALLNAARIVRKYDATV